MTDDATASEVLVVAIVTATSSDAPSVSPPKVCFLVRDVRPVVSLRSRDGRQVVHLLMAPDSQSVRDIFRQQRLPTGVSVTVFTEQEGMAHLLGRLRSVQLGAC